MSESAPQSKRTRALRAQAPANGRAHATHAFRGNVILTGDQLAFDLESAMGSEDDFETRLREAVAEPDMTEDEITAALEDAHHRLGLGPVEATEVPPCICEGGAMVLIDALAVERRCARCGREPRR